MNTKFTDDFTLTTLAKPEQDGPNARLFSFAKFQTDKAGIRFGRSFYSLSRMLQSLLAAGSSLHARLGC